MAYKHSSLDYREAKRILDGYPSLSFKPRKRQTRSADKVKLANNTYLIREEAQRFALELHGCAIVTFTPHYMEFNTCGWPTMTTSERMRWTPVEIQASRGGWALYPFVEIPCGSCHGTLTDPYGGGYTLSDELVTPQGGGTPYYPAIWHAAPCAACDKTGKRMGYDRESGGHPFFDGMRTDAKGTRLLQRQPNRPENFEPVKTVSGFDYGGVPRDYYGVTVGLGGMNWT